MRECSRRAHTAGRPHLSGHSRSAETSFLRWDLPVKNMRKGQPEGVCGERGTGGWPGPGSQSAPRGHRVVLGPGERSAWEEALLRLCLRVPASGRPLLAPRSARRVSTPSRGSREEDAALRPAPRPRFLHRFPSEGGPPQQVPFQSQGRDSSSSHVATEFSWDFTEESPGDRGAPAPRELERALRLARQPWPRGSSGTTRRGRHVASVSSENSR